MLQVVIVIGTIFDTSNKNNILPSLITERILRKIDEDVHFFFLSWSSLHRHIKQKILQLPGTAVFLQYLEKRENRIKNYNKNKKNIIYAQMAISFYEQ